MTNFYIVLLNSRDPIALLHATKTNKSLKIFVCKFKYYKNIQKIYDWKLSQSTNHYGGLGSSDLKDKQIYFFNIKYSNHRNSNGVPLGLVSKTTLALSLALHISLQSLKRRQFPTDVFTLNVGSYWRYAN